MLEPYISRSLPLPPPPPPPAICVSFPFNPWQRFSAIFQQRVPASTYIGARVVARARAWLPLSIYCGATEAVERERERERRERERAESRSSGVVKRERGKGRESKGMSGEARSGAAGRVQLPSSQRVRLTLYDSGYFCGQLFLSADRSVRSPRLTALS